MLILGIETSTKTGSIAIVSEKAVVAQYSLNIEVTHSERLMSTIDRVLKDSGTDMKDISGFAVSIGPGSFTGLRIGLAAVKGLALATGKPLAGISTLEILARNLPFAAYPVCPLLDARKNEVYCGVYRFENAVPVQVMQDAVLPIKELASKIPGKTVFTGEASVLYRDAIEEQLGERALFAPLSAVLPSAATLAEAGLAIIKQGRHADPDSLSPLYIRRPEAEVAWEKRQS